MRGAAEKDRNRARLEAEQPRPNIAFISSRVLWSVCLGSFSSMNDGARIRYRSLAPYALAPHQWVGQHHQRLPRTPDRTCDALAPGP